MKTSYENRCDAVENDYARFRDGDVMRIGYNHYQIGSVASYAIKNGDCPMEAIEHAKENGHDMYYVFGLGASITAHKQKIDYGRPVEYGQRIIFEGHIFELEVARNQNIGLKMIS